MIKRITSFMLIMAILSAPLVPTVSAADSASLTAADVSATVGGYAYVYVKADAFTDVQSLDFQLHYDSSVMSVYYTSKGTMLSGATSNINSSTPGVIKVSAISVSGMNCTYATTVMTVCFKIDANCPAGDYNVKLTVGDAYNGDLSPVAISGDDITVTVKEAPSKTFTLYGTPNTSTLSVGETYSLSVYHSSSYTFASADFRVEYDRDLFTLGSVTLADKLKTEDAVYSVNTSIEGTVIISYAATNAVSSSNLFKLELIASANVDESATVTVTASSVYDNDLNPYAPYTLTKDVAFSRVEAAPDYPDVWLDTEPLTVGSFSTSTFILEKGSDVAAADFTVVYDPQVLKCANVSVADGVSDTGGIVMINKNFTEGTVKFSYVNESAYDDADLPLVLITWEPLLSPSEHYSVTLTGAGVVNAAWEDVTLEYATESGCIYVATVTAATCTQNGYTTYTCSCGYSFRETIEAVGHDYEEDFTVDLEPTDTTEGSKSRHCTRCDAVTDVTVIPALGISTDIPWGDVDGSGEVDFMDALYLTRYAEQWDASSYADAEYILERGDVDGSGEVDFMDALYLTRYTEQWDASSYADATNLLKSIYILWGDVDDSGEVDFMDALYLTRYTEQWDADSYADADHILERGDVDGSGEVDFMDALYLTRYTEQWDTDSYADAVNLLKTIS